MVWPVSREDAKEYTITTDPSRLDLEPASRKFYERRGEAGAAQRELPNDKTIRVLRFAAERADDKGQRPSWGELFDMWNAAYLKEAYSERNSFRKAYNRAVKALVPPYRPYA